MSKFSTLSMAFVGMLVLTPAVPAFAQEHGVTPRQIQTMIETGESGQAIKALKNVLAEHPDSGVAWYLMAEAQDAKGQEAAAAQALAKADQYAPGLPFANAQDAQALRTHINNGMKAAGGHHSAGGVSIVLLVIVALIALFVILRMVAGWGRRRPPMNPPYPGGPATPYGGNYGPNGPYPYGPAPGGGGFGGGGLGSSIVTGLAAGAGFAAGERVVDGLMGGHEAQAAPPQSDQDSSFGAQDDGLSGDPGWGGGGDDDIGNDDSW